MAQKNEKPIPTRIFLGTGTVRVKENANPEFNGSDGAFLRQAALIEQFKGFVDAYNENQNRLQQNFADVDEIIADIQKRLKELEDFMNGIVRPTEHLRRLKESHEPTKTTETSALSLEQIGKLEGEARKQAFRKLILKNPEGEK